MLNQEITINKEVILKRIEKLKSDLQFFELIIKQRIEKQEDDKKYYFLCGKKDTLKNEIEFLESLLEVK